MKKSISLLGAVSIGIGGMVGGGIFAVLGEAVSLAKGATYIAFFYAGVVAFLTAYSYAKLSTTYISRGGTVTFIDNAFRHNLLSGSVNLMLFLSYIVTISLYATAFAYYSQILFSNKSWLLHHTLISLAIILPAVINYVSSSFVSKSETFFVVTKLVLLLVIVVAGFMSVDFERLLPKNYESISSVIVAGMIIFVAYEGFELISNSAEEITEPKKNLPKAFYISVVSVVVLYMLIAVVTVGNVDEATLKEAKDYALAVAAKPTLGEFGFVLVSVSAMLATLSAINATIFSNSRLSYYIAKEGKLPKLLAMQKGETPLMGIVISTLLGLLLANSINLDDIAIIGSAGFLLIFFVVNISAYKLREKSGANGFVIVLAVLSSFAALVMLLYHTYKTNPVAIYVFLGFVVFSVLFEYIYGVYVRGHIFKRGY